MVGRTARFIVTSLLVASSLVTTLCGCGASGKSPTNPSGDAYAGMRVDVVVRMNELRATIGLPALVRWTEGEACADGQAKSDSESHQPHGAFGMCNESTRNECPDWPTTESISTGCLQDKWDEVPGSDYSTQGHYMNMTNTSYHKVAVGFYTTPAGEVLAVMDFAP